jgi:hypothetical protein
LSSETRGAAAESATVSYVRRTLPRIIPLSGIGGDAGALVRHKLLKSAEVRQFPVG